MPGAANTITVRFFRERLKYYYGSSLIIMDVFEAFTVFKGENPACGMKNLTLSSWDHYKCFRQERFHRCMGLLVPWKHSINGGKSPLAQLRNPFIFKIQGKPLWLGEFVMMTTWAALWTSVRCKKVESSLRIFADFLQTEMLIGSNGQRNLAIASAPKLNKTLDLLKSQIPRFLWHGSVQEQQTRVYCTDKLEAMQW